MLVPGSNLLGMAFNLIAQQRFRYHRAIGRATNAIGNDIPFYGITEESGSIQPVDRQVFVINGLDLQKNYYNVFVRKNAQDVDRDCSGDFIEWQCKRLQFISSQDWFGMDGWVKVLTVEAGSV